MQAYESDSAAGADGKTYDVVIVGAGGAGLVAERYDSGFGPSAASTAGSIAFAVRR